MMNFEEIKMELTKKGFDARINTAVKNGNVIPCITVKQTEKLYVNLYASTVKDKTIDEIVELCKRQPDFNPDDITPKFIYENVMVGVQAKGTENLIKRETEFDGIEKYLYVKISDENSFKLKEESTFGSLNRAKLWEKAEENTYKSAEIGTIESILSGKDRVSLDTATDTDPNFTFVTTKNGFRGASIITIKKAVDKLKEIMGAKELIVIPSSIHEVIVMNKLDGIDIDDIKEMVLSVNANEVSAEDKLIDNAYVI